MVEHIWAGIVDTFKGFQKLYIGCLAVPPSGEQEDLSSSYDA